MHSDLLLIKDGPRDLYAGNKVHHDVSANLHIVSQVCGKFLSAKDITNKPIRILLVSQLYDLNKDLSDHLRSP